MYTQVNPMLNRILNPFGALLGLLALATGGAVVLVATAGNFNEYVR